MQSRKQSSYITSVGKSVHIFMARNRVSKSCLTAELCFHRFVHLIVFRYIFSAFTTSSVLRLEGFPFCEFDLSIVQ